MAKFLDKCPECGKEFWNYEDPLAYRLHCSLGCSVAEGHKEQLDAVYSERNRCVAALARLAQKLGYRVGVGSHDPEDSGWDTEWRTILFIDLPTPSGDALSQVSWHFHDRERSLLEGLPEYEGQWDGHSTEEKYARLEKLKEAPPDGLSSVTDRQCPRKSGEDMRCVRHLGHPGHCQWED